VGDDPAMRQQSRFLRSQGLRGVFIGAHAVAEGILSMRQLREGPYIRIMRGVYADPSLPRDHQLRCQAAAMLMPPGAAIGGHSAAVLLGGPQPGWSDPVTVVLPRDVQWRGPAGIRVHRAALPPDDVVASPDGIWHTAPERTAWDVAVLENLRTAVGILDTLVRAGTLDLPRLLALARDGAGRWGVTRVRRAFELVDGQAMSPPESWVRVACAQAGLPAPVPQYDVIHDGVWLGAADLVWPEAKLIVEYEGEYHFDELQIVRDDGRYERFIAAGWRVIRFAAHDLRDMAALVARIAAALAAEPVAG
jgi:Protein of unknown function (DUF559)